MRPGSSQYKMSSHQYRNSYHKVKTVANLYNENLMHEKTIFILRRARGDLGHSLFPSILLQDKLSSIQLNDAFNGYVFLAALSS